MQYKDQQPQPIQRTISISHQRHRIQHTKNNSQKQTSEQNTAENNKNENGNNNIDSNISTNNDKNTVYNCRIEHATIATVTNNRFTTKCTIDIRPEKPNSIINSTKIHQQIFEAIKKWMSPQQLSHTITIVSQIVIHSQLTKNTPTSFQTKEYPM